MDEGALRTAVSAALLNAEDEHRRLLQSIVDAARCMFDAAVSLIFMLDETADQLVFEAVAGERDGFVVGRSFPASRGIAGWVLSAGEPVIINDLAANPSFAPDLAASTRYIPQAVMATPLICDEEALGVLEVLDQVPNGRGALGELNLLSLFAGQAAAALRIVQRSRAVRRLYLETEVPADRDMADLLATARMLTTADPERRAAGLHVLRALLDVPVR